jgi:hypothetical protein
MRRADVTVKLCLLAMLLLGAAGASMGRLAGTRAASQPSSASSSPASRPAESRPDYPPADLVRATRAAAETLRARLDGTFNVVAVPPFVVAGNLPSNTLELYAQGSVLRPAEAMWASYFRARCDRVVTVLLLADADSYRQWAEKLFGDKKDLPYFGYYRSADRTLVMNIHTGTGTLVHELTHALIAFDWPAVPTWFNEGLSSLHEQCQVSPDQITGLANWRLRGLQQAIGRGQLRGLAELTTRDDFLGELRGLNYAHARYFCMYLQDRGLLGTFYAKYHQAHAKGTPAPAVIEEVCGEPITETDKKLSAWVMTLKWD